SWLARIPTRVGYARPWRNFFLTTTLPSPTAVKAMRKRSLADIQTLIAENPASPTFSRAQTGAVHQTHDYLRLVGALGANTAPLAPHLAVTETELNDARVKFGLAQNSRPIFGLNPGAEYGPAKRWPASQFIAVARELQKKTDCVWLILGGKTDIALAEEIRLAISDLPAAAQSLAGRTSLRELCAVLKLCRVVLTNDTGPMHVAAALGTPVVVPFGSTSPELTGPGLPGDERNFLIQSNAPCSPCFLRECPIDFRCMKGIPVETVVAAVMKAAAQ
ncbi:MAG: lipopolysaccharide heptosyltransferase II, partial [Akkermansiaceae bacterium]|nr:lipopolysaccharide heptosyltransferase II [Verrucomicrobiales bacterium]